MNPFLLQITIIGLAGFAAQWAAWRLKIPAIVFLLLTGFLFGPVFGLLRPDEFLGELMRPAVSVAVSIILFEASLNLKLREIKEFSRSVRHIVLIGGTLSWVLTGLAAHYIAGLSWPTAMTFGGLLIVTGPTVIMPLLRSARLNPRIGSILKWEGIINDPLGVLYAILAFEYFSYAHEHPAVDGLFYMHFVGILAGVGLFSVALGFVAAFILNRGYVPEYLKAYFLFILVIAVFCVCNVLMEESGLLAVTLLGMTMGNRHVSSLEDIRKFKETVTLLLVSGVFLLLTASLDPSVLLTINLRGMLFIVCLLVLIRPAAMLVSGIGTKLSSREVLMIGWVAPRGVVCAAVAGVMGPQLVEAGFEDGARLLPLAFAIVIVTVVLHSLTVKPLARRMGLSSMEAGGQIIVGVSEWSLQLAELLREKGVPVLVADSNYHRLKKARLANLPVFYGEILSEEAEFTIDYAGYRGLLAATDNNAYNALVCNAYANDFGRENVWQLSGIEEAGAERKKVALELQGRIFGPVGLDSESLHERFRRGLRFRTTKIGSRPEQAEAVIMAEAEGVKIGIIRGGALYLRSPELDVPSRDGDMLLWLGLPKVQAAPPVREVATS